MFTTRWNKDPLLAFIDSHIINYPTPLNLNYMWSFGSLAGLGLVIQIITGIFFAVHYTPHVDLAFSSVEHIMRDVNNGWLIRYIHANGVSLFFIVTYAHIFRGIYFGSYTYPRGFLWCSGVVIFLLMMATAFMGYVLPWDQMSFWGATVITNLFSAIPFIGDSIVEWLFWGGVSVDNATLNRFFSLHYLMPFLIAGFVLVHLSLLHTAGSNNPLGVNSNIDSIVFYPYFYAKDVFVFLIYVLLLCFFVSFCLPELILVLLGNAPLKLFSVSRQITLYLYIGVDFFRNHGLEIAIFCIKTVSLAMILYRFFLAVKSYLGNKNLFYQRLKNKYLRVFILFRGKTRRRTFFFYFFFIKTSINMFFIVSVILYFGSISGADLLTCKTFFFIISQVGIFSYYLLLSYGYYTSYFFLPFKQLGMFGQARELITVFGLRGTQIILGGALVSIVGGAAWEVDKQLVEATGVLINGKRVGFGPISSTLYLWSGFITPRQYRSYFFDPLAGSERLIEIHSFILNERIKNGGFLSPLKTLGVHNHLRAKAKILDTEMVEKISTERLKQRMLRYPMEYQEPKIEAQQRWREKVMAEQGLEMTNRQIENINDSDTLKLLPPYETSKLLPYSDEFKSNVSESTAVSTKIQAPKKSQAPSSSIWDID